MQVPGADTHQADFGVGDAGIQLVAGGQLVVCDGIGPAVNVDATNLP